MKISARSNLTAALCALGGAVAVAAPPLIDSFTAEADPAGPRGARVLRWQVLGAETVLIKTADGAVAHSGAVGETIALVPRGAQWRYLDDGSDQGAAWREPAFDDSGWPRGPSQLGYGERDEATVVGFGGLASNRFATTYLRHRFVVDEPGAGRDLTLRVAYDDGVIIYLNGVEVARLNMPQGEVAYDTYALTDNPDDGRVFEAIPLDAGLLQPGTNDFAVELHQSRPGSSDLSFDLALDRVEDRSLSVHPSSSPLYVLEASNADGSSSASVDISTVGDNVLFLPLDEATGVTPADSCGKAAAALMPADGTSFPTGDGDSLHFDGTRALAVGGDSLRGIGARLGEGVSVGFWLNADPAAGPCLIVDASAGGKGLQIARAVAGGLELRLNGIVLGEIDGAALFDSLWHHLVVSASAGDALAPGTLRVHVDGVELATYPWAGGGFGTPETWGIAGDAAGGQGFAGSLRELAIFDAALEDAAIALWISGGAESLLVPRIEAFAPRDPSLPVGGSTLLHWVTPNADSVAITGAPPPLPGFDDRAEVSLDSGQSYTLTATNAFGSAMATATIEVGAPPQLISFTADPNPVSLGSSATLSWQTSAADEVRIEPGGLGSAGPFGEINVSPQSGTRYTLTATNVFGSVGAELDLATSTDPAPGSWTLAVLPDTQHYADNALNAPIFTAMTEWLAANKERRNIRFVTHVGDIVENNTAIEWDRVGESLSRLDGVIPYGLALGNHDYQSNAATRASLFADPARFGEGSAYRTQQTFGGSFQHPEDPPGRADSCFHTFEVGGFKYLMLCFEYAPRDATLAWANDVVAAHPDHLAMLSVHIYVNNVGGLAGNPGAPAVVGGVDQVNGGASMWDKLVRRHPNFAMAFCGHQLGQPQLLTGTGDAGNPVHQMLFNVQDGPSGGDGFLRLLEFSADGARCVVKTYSPHRDALGLDAWRSDPANLFELSLVPPADPDADGDGMDDAWEVAHGLDPEDGGDGDHDTDGDGLVNRLEFVFARDPQVRESEALLAPSVSAVGDEIYLSLRFRRRAGAEVGIQSSQGLAEWIPENTFVDQIEVNGDGTENVTLRISSPLGSATAGQYRGVAN